MLVTAVMGCGASSASGRERDGDATRQALLRIPSEFRSLEIGVAPFTPVAALRPALANEIDPVDILQKAKVRRGALAVRAGS